jgi:hypothetical protein
MGKNITIEKKYWNQKYYNKLYSRHNTKTSKSLQKSSFLFENILMLVHNPNAILHIRNDVLQSPVFPQQSII